MKLLPKIGILAAGIIMSVSFAAGIRGNDAIEVSAAGDLVATFELGANGAAGHKDGSENATYTEEDGKYTLSITGGTKMYTGAIDAKGNSCIKFGTKSAVGSMSFTVPSDVTEVVLHVGKYKDKTSKISVNGGDAQDLSGSSDNGAYDEITVDTSSTKTVTFTTVSGGVRAMLNTIEYYSNPSTAKVLDRISAELITSKKTVWYVDETVTEEYVQVTAHYTNGESATVTSGYTLSDNTLSLGVNEITVEYEEIECQLKVTAIAKPILKSATITGTAKAAVGGVWDLSDLDVYGTSTTDEDMGDITDKCELSTDASTEDAGNYTITVSVTYEGVTVDVHNVSAKVLNTVEKTDVLTKTTTGAEGTTYKTWYYTSDVTGAKYCGNSAGGNESIQIRSNTGSGIITLVSGGLVKSVSVKWNSNTQEGRQLDIYGSDSSYSLTTYLYGDDTKGDLVHTFTYSAESAEQTYDFEADYQYIGIRSKSNAQYIDQISITWASYVEEPEEPEEP